MSIDLAAIANDPALFLFAFDGEFVRVQEMTRDSFARSVFLDDRIHHGRRQVLKLPLVALLEAWPSPPASERAFGIVFHIAQCGSTLLARALDLPGKSLVLREPGALRQLGSRAGAGADRAAIAADPQFARMLDFTLGMLGKGWAGETVVAKANVPVNFIAEEVLAAMPGTPALLLHFALAPYLAAVIRSEGHERWVDSVFEELRLADNEFVAPDMPDTTATRAAALWFAQMKQFERVLERFPHARSLDAERFFADPTAVVAASARLFEIDLPDAEIQRRVEGEMFATYSKNPALDYDAEVREVRAAEARKRLAPQIEQALAWAQAAKARRGLCDALARPLVGDPVPLLG